MKRIVFCMLALLMLTACAGKPVDIRIGEPVLASFSARDLEGNPVDQTVFSNGRLTMINVWGTFCGPCVDEMPALMELQQANTGLQVIGIVLDAADRNGQIKPEKLEQALQIIETTGAQYLHILPSPSLYGALLEDVQAVPLTVFVDSRGYQVGPVYAGAKTKEQWNVIIAAMLEVLP